MLMNQFDNIDKLFFTLAIIIFTTNIIYLLMQKFNRPIVLGGIMAGIIINHLHLSAKYFDINTCAGLGQMGIVLFMMVVGQQLSYKNLFTRKIYMPITLLNMIIPFIFGFILAGYLVFYNFAPNNAYIPSYKASLLFMHVPLSTDPKIIFMFKVFVGLAISMTAFPILSMFLNHSRLTNSIVGRIALFCGFIDEIFFWLILGVVLVSIQQNAIIKSFKPIDIIFYLIFISFIAPKILAIITKRIKRQGTMLGFLVVGCIASAALSDSVDLHQVFGGFLFGLILPRDNPLILIAKKRIIDVVNVILLPVYFVQTGIVSNIHISLDLTAFYLTIIVTIIALLGKFGGTFLAGRMLGLPTSESTLLGSLLNIRGIIEIVLLNVGLDVGIINDRMYTILVGMTILCTFIATSASLYLSKRYKDKLAQTPQIKNI